MSYPYTPAAVSPNPAGAPGFGGPVSMPPPPGGPVPLPLPPQRRDEKSSRHGIFVAAVISAVLGVFIAGALGVYVGSRLTSNTSQQQSAQTAPVAPTPTAGQVHAATVDLCTRFAAGYRAMPSPQNTGFDVIPSLNYIADALRDNPIADNAIRDAIAESLRIARDQASHLSNEPARGAIQPSTTWTPEVANRADQRVWDLCRAYGG
jgi:hypothetical protein